MSLLPSSPDIVPDSNPRVVGVDTEDADRLMSALSSATARGILAELHTDPASPAALSERVDTSLQNTQYHLSNLSDAGAVEVVGTAYSEKGREMDVYAPADQPLVIFAGRDEAASGLRAALKRLLGAVFALAVGSLAIQQVFGQGIGQLFPAGTSANGGGDGAPASGGAQPTETPTPASQAGDGGVFTGGEGGTTATSAPESTAAGPGTATATPAATDVSRAGEQATGTPTEAATATARAADAPSATQTVADTVTATPTPDPTSTPEAVQLGGEVVMTLPPGVLFFLGGLTVLAVAVALDSRR